MFESVSLRHYNFNIKHMNSSKTIAWVIGVGVLVIAGISYALFGNTTPADVVVDQTTSNTIDTTGSSTTPVSTSTNTVNTSNTTPVATTQISGYKDGTYTASGTYKTPQTTETVNVTLTLKNGIVTDTSMTGSPVVPNSIRFQGQFIANYKPLVIGKSIDTLNLTNVSGSSLTSGGFNDAVAKIKVPAKA